MPTCFLTSSLAGELDKLEPEGEKPDETVRSKILKERGTLVWLTLTAE